MNLKHTENFNKDAINFFYATTFLLGIAAAAVLYLESSYFKAANGKENVIFFYVIAYAIALGLILIWHNFVRILGSRKLFLSTLALKTLAVAVLAVTPLSPAGAWLLIIYMVLTVMNWLDLDILLEGCSVDKKTGKIRGLYLTIMNAGYLVAPLAAGYMVNSYGFQSVFALTAAVLLLIFVLAWRNAEYFGACKLKRMGIIDLLKKALTRKNILRMYYVSFLLELFYALMIIYSPLYLLSLGLNWAQIGRIFFFMLLPFVLLQYPAGYLADKKYEERDMIAVALVVMSFFSGVVYFLASGSVLIWALVLFGTRIGASLIEILRDSYFYKRIDQRDVELMDFFRTVRPVAYLVGSFIALPVIYFFGLKSIFFVLSVILLTGLLPLRNLASSRVPPRLGKA